MLFSQTGEELNCHSMLLAEFKTGACKSASHQRLVTLLTSLTTQGRGKTVHLGSIYLHYFAQGPSLSPLPSHTYPNKRCYDCMQMDNMSSLTHKHTKHIPAGTHTYAHYHKHHTKEELFRPKHAKCEIF